MRKIVKTKAFKKDYKKLIVKGNYPQQEFINVLFFIINNLPLPEKYNNHKLKGIYSGLQECHIRPDWLLIYELVGDNEVSLKRMGSHSELFS